jgi:LysM repeat protein
MASGISYTVRKGDTLGRIARRYNLSTEQLRRTNQISGDLIRVGQKLHLPVNKIPVATSKSMSRAYTVQRGDTLSKIAQINRISVAELKALNGLSSDLIRIGQTLFVPKIINAADLLTTVRAINSRIQVRANNWKGIVVHHSAIKNGNAVIYDKNHRKKGMQNGLAYHFVIGNGIDSGDGEIETGRRWTHQLQGGHVKNHKINLTAIGICLIGNFQETRPSTLQIEAFTQLMDWLRSEVVPKAKQFAGHRELRGEQTVCPGKNFPLAAMHSRYG